MPNSNIGIALVYESDEKRVIAKIDEGKLQQMLQEAIDQKLPAQKLIQVLRFELERIVRVK